MHPRGVHTAMRSFFITSMTLQKKSFGSGLYAPRRSAYCYALIFLMYHLRNILVPKLSKGIDLLSDLLAVAELLVNRNLVKL